MIIGLKSPGPGCAHRSALAHRDWLSSSHRRGARRSPPVAALPYSVFGLHRNLRCRCDLAPTRQSIGNSFHAGAGWGIFFAFCLPPLKILGIKVLTRVRFDAQGRPEGGVGRGGVYSVGPTPTLPLVRAPSFSRADAASPRRRPRVGPGRPQGTNPRNMSIARPRHDGLSIPRRKGLRFGFRGRAKRETGPRGPGRQFESTCLRRQLSGT